MTDRATLLERFRHEIPILEHLTPDNGDETLRKVGYPLSLADIKVLVAALEPPETHGMMLVSRAFWEQAAEAVRFMSRTLRENWERQNHELAPALDAQDMKHCAALLRSLKYTETDERFAIGIPQLRSPR